MQENLLQNNILNSEEYDSDLAEEDDVGTENELKDDDFDNSSTEEEKDEY